MEIKRRKTKRVYVGDVPVGGDAPISVQSMTNTITTDIKATVDQIKRLEDAGCEIVRVAVPDQKAALALGEIKRQISIPLVADIHFNYRLALIAVEQGVDKIRINPGNIGSKENIHRVLKACKDRNIPIRIGVNSGSLERDLLLKYDGVCAEALAESALRHLEICYDFGFEEVILSLKSSDVRMTMDSYRLIAEKTDRPLHLGVTEAGTSRTGTVRSAIGIGVLLAEGIGDTIRVSLTGDPVEEVKVGYEILKSLRLREHGVTLIACPTCGRLEVDLEKIVQQVERETAKIDKPIRVSILGCVVNGPGEAKEADIGVACGRHSALLFKKGKIIKKLREEEVVKSLVEEIQKWQP